jgi:hypothetical protein
LQREVNWFLTYKKQIKFLRYTTNHFSESCSSSTSQLMSIKCTQIFPLTYYDSISCHCNVAMAMTTVMNVRNTITNIIMNL